MMEFGIRDGFSFTYMNTSNPAVDTNPKALSSTWLNTASGEIFVCTDNSIGANVWKGQMGTTVS